MEDVQTLAPNLAITAPTDGRVILGYFTGPGGEARFAATSWKDGRWVDLLDKPIPKHLTLAGWGEG
jgi:hypothetical protein